MCKEHRPALWCPQLSEASLTQTKGLEPYPEVHFQNPKILSGSESRKALH